MQEKQNPANERPDINNQSPPERAASDQEQCDRSLGRECVVQSPFGQVKANECLNHVA